MCLGVTHAIPLLIASSTHLVRAPSHDTAVVQSDRLGGNFAYSSIVGHAYAAVTPIVQNIPTAVAVSHSVAIPVAVPVAVVSHTVPSQTSYPQSANLSAYALESATLPKEHRGLTTIGTSERVSDSAPNYFFF